MIISVTSKAASGRSCFHDHLEFFLDFIDLCCRLNGAKMWRDWFNGFLKPKTLNNMSKETDQVQFHASSTGRLYIKEEELFKTQKFKKLLAALMGSTLYKELKENASQKGSTSK